MKSQSHHDILDLFNELVKGFGVESIELDGETIGYYVNRGDSYDETIIWDESNGEFIISSWADFLEESENEYCKEWDKIKCGYCGGFHQLNPIDWRLTGCELNSDYNVDGSNSRKELEELE